jgi:hypothetical protein
MLVCSIIDELDKVAPEQNQLCYFFCQATDARINNANAVLRSLLYMLIDQQPSLVRHIDQQHRHAGRNAFEDVNSWVVLTKIFSDIMQDPYLRHTVFIVDALDECTSELTNLLDFIVSTSTRSPHVKWLFSSRGWPIIKEPLARAEQMLTMRLELNAKTIASRVRIYSEQKVRELAAKKGYDEPLKRHVLQYVQDNAGDTFLWVALVCKSLHMIHWWHVRDRLREFPSGLDGLYVRMMDDIAKSDDEDNCKAVLVAVTLAFRPLTLRELGCIANLSESISYNVEVLEHIVRSSGCFLTVRDEAQCEKVVHFVHQSAKDFIINKANRTVFPSGLEAAHVQLAARCLTQLEKPNVLRKDLCDVRKPGARRSEFDTTYIAHHLGPKLTYSCGYWAEHVIKGQQVLSDNDSVYKFLQQHFLHWLEALSWLGQLSIVIHQITQLKSRVKVCVSAIQK